MSSEANVVAILDAILEGFQVVDAAYRYVHVNEAAARHGRTDRASLLGRTMMECYPGIETTSLFEHIRSAMVQRTAHVLENAFTFPDGSIGHFELRIQPVPEGVCVLSIDVTARKDAEHAQARAEERLQHGQRMDAMGQLAAGIAHDFNNLVTVILGQGEEALARPEGPSRQDVEAIVAAARTSSSLTQQLLAYGRRTVLARGVFDLRDALRSLEPLLRASIGRRVDLRVDVEGSVEPVDADRAQIDQVVMNLAMNARDAMPHGGKLTLTLGRVELDESFTATHEGARPGPHVVLTVIDTGSGMDAATQARIFEPFFTTKGAAGTGLGLASTYGIVRQHGGTIWVYSELGRGTSFKVFLPLAGPASIASVTPPKPASEPPAAKRDGAILIAEDSPALQRLLSITLGRLGRRLILASDGNEAWAAWQENASEIALLVTDSSMPGMRGPELIRRVREADDSLPIICTSGYASNDVELSGLPVGVVFVEKPFTPKAMLAQVHALLGPSGAAEE